MVEIENPYIDDPFEDIFSPEGIFDAEDGNDEIYDGTLVLPGDTIMEEPEFPLNGDIRSQS